MPLLRDDQRRVFYADSPYRVLMCGRRWGKTTGMYEWQVSGALAGKRCGWVVPDFSYSETFWNQITREMASVIERKDTQKHRIYFITGGEIHFWSTKISPDPCRGEAYHQVGIDEAGLMRNLSSVVNESIFPALSDHDGDLVIQGTPKGAGREFAKMHLVAKQGEDGWLAFNGATEDNPRISRKWIDNARRVMTKEQFDQEMRGIPAKDGGNPFGIDAIQRAIGPMSTKEPVVWGVDLGSTQDWTVIIGMDEDGSVCRFERFQNDWEHTSTRLQAMLGDLPAYVDATGVGKPVVERLQKQCAGIEGFIFTSDSKHGLIADLTAAFQLAEIRIPDDKQLITELDAFGFTYTPSGRVRYEGPTGMHDDCVCALALAWQCYGKHGGAGARGPLVDPGLSRPMNARSRGNRWAS